MVRSPLWFKGFLAGPREQSPLGSVFVLGSADLDTDEEILAEFTIGTPSHPALHLFPLLPTCHGADHHQPMPRPTPHEPVPHQCSVQSQCRHNRGVHRADPFGVALTLLVPSPQPTPLTYNLSVASVKHASPRSGVFIPNRRIRVLAESKVSPSITRSTGMRGHSLQQILVKHSER